MKIMSGGENQRIDSSSFVENNVVHLESNRMVCGSFMYVFEKGKIEVRNNNVLVKKYDVSVCFLDKNGKKIIFTTIDDKKLVLYNLCKNEEIIYFKIEENESLQRAVKIKNNRYLIELKVGSAREVYEIETELERLEYVEGDLDHFNSDNLVPPLAHE